MKEKYLTLISSRDGERELGPKEESKMRGITRKWQENH